MPKRTKLNIAIFCGLLYIYLPRMLYCAELKKREWKNLDPAKGLNDAEVEMALHDLSLSDLNALNELVDSANQGDYNYDDTSLLKDNNDKDLNLDDPSINNHDYINYDAALEVDPQYPVGNALDKSQETENQRSKRDDHHQVQVNEEYIKQLDFSFPRDIQPNQPEENDIKKDHIRVKRNAFIM